MFHGIQVVQRTGIQYKVLTKGYPENDCKVTVLMLSKISNDV